MWKFLDTVLDRICAVLGALIFSQAPAFIQQYIQRLSGSTDELKLQVQQIQKISNSAGLSAAEYIEKFNDSGDFLFERQGEIISYILERYETLNHALSSMENAWWFTRPFTFLFHVQSDVFYGTLKHFTPAVNVSIEGIVWAFIGLMIGYFLYNGMKKALIEIWGAIRNVFKRKKKQPDHESKG